MRAIRLRMIAGAAGLAALAACDVPAPTAIATAPAPQRATPDTGIAPQSAESRALAAYYARVQNDLVAQGLLRQDFGSVDAPFSQRQLVENFIRIALFEEFVTVGGRMVARQSESRLHRWQQPVRMAVEFGASVPEAQRRQDSAAVRSYAARLSRVSGLPVQVAANPARANFHVFIVNEDERRQLGPRLSEIVPGIGQSAVQTVEQIPRSTFCLVFAVDPGNDGRYTHAVAVIRGEHPDLLRLSCIHEELAQGLGLSNDSPQARPSLFNDDEEFALLTRHDELLLRILYDPRLRPGMTVDQARPIVRQIVAEIMGSGII